ncbi:VOC family protein [Mucilaginibacter sp. Bleaf8]|uniref:VOC family protein n=1 Tax=Mucilaginibacter sp. Bleaf8 TaxID=2834430 RepID=UPI001BD1A2F4|nr:VOC family protein [Mucilaginibacter sp. Bleaf8]MBS7565949.1 VOC family protein [Mucilaginibacter sp. Bleaf8]
MRMLPQFTKLTLKATAGLLLIGTPLISHAQTVGKAVFNHAALCSKDLKRSNAFYTSVLGLKIIPNPFKDTIHTWYSIAPHVTMHVIQGNCSPAPKLIGDHLCFSMPSINDFVAMLKQKGIAYTNWKGVPGQVEHRVDGVSQVYIQDPDGYWIEINDAK